MKKLIVFILIAALFIPVVSLAEEEVSRDFTSIHISEIMASNSAKILTAEDGGSYDWIELYNSSDKPVNLKGLCLSDSKKKLEKFVFPDTVIPAGGYLIVFCSGEEKITDTELHTAFKLAAEGEKVVLSYEGVILEKVSFEAQIKDVSLALSDDGEWHQTVTPTPGYLNVVTGLE